MIGTSLAAFASILDTAIEDQRVIQGFCIDSRATKPGFVFFAIKGSVYDGHDFLEQVRDKGAVAAVVDRSYEGSIEDFVLIYVDDVKEALQSVAKFWVSQSSSRVLAITGSMGKTTTKEICYALLSTKYKVFKTPGNANSQLGMPLSLINDRLEYDILVLEMGMSQAGQISKLVGIAPPEVAIVTKIAPAHIAFFSDGLQGISRAKAEIIAGDKLQCAIISSQAADYEALAHANAPLKIFYAREEYAPYKHLHWWLEATDQYVVIRSKEELSPKLPLPYDAPHLLENFIAAALAARYFGLSWEDIKKGALMIKPIEKRFEKRVVGGVVFIIDCYNANPDSVCQALSCIPIPVEGSRKIAVLGPMVELGEHSATFHHEVGKSAAENVDELFCLAKECAPMALGFEHCGKKAYHLQDIEELKEKLFAFVQEGDVVLLKASNKVGLWRVLE